MALAVSVPVSAHAWHTSEPTRHPPAPEPAASEPAPPSRHPPPSAREELREDILRVLWVEPAAAAAAAP